MKILLLNGSPRKNGNTEIMADAFIEGAEKSGHTVKKFNLCQMSVAPCKGCEYCFAHDNTCLVEDDMIEIYEALDLCDMVVFASPIYYFSITAQLQAAITRFYAKALVGYNVTKAALLLNSGDPDVYNAAIAQYDDILEYIGWDDKGIITISGMEAKGDMKNSPALASVRKLGEGLA